jgi:universal stress protein A
MSGGPRSRDIHRMRSKAFGVPGIGDDTGQSTFRQMKILVPVDFSPASKKLLKYVSRLAGKFSAQVTLLHVLAPAPSPNFAGTAGAPTVPETELSAEEGLRALIVSPRNGSVVRARGITRTGVPSHEIVEMAKEAGIDLIVIGALGRTGGKQFCIGSTVERVVRAAPCSVLVVREEA